jgi:hypothetical protein
VTGLFRRREPVPAELAFLAEDQWGELARSVDKAAKRLGGRREGSVVRFEDDKLLNLGNLGRICAQLPRQAWPPEVTRFLSVFQAGVDPLDVIRADPAAARAQLRVRPYPEEAFVDLPFAVVSRPLAGELLDVLCLDFPDQVAMVNEKMLAAFAGAEDELFDVGLANVRAEGRPERADQVASQGVAIDLFHGHSFYSATWGRWADALVPGIGGHGALVAMPYRHQILVHALHSGKGAATGPGLILWLAHAGVSDGPGPVSAELFWWRDGRLSHLPGGVDGEEIHFTPTDEYLAVVEHLIATRPE